MYVFRGCFPGDIRAWRISCENLAPGFFWEELKELWRILVELLGVVAVSFFVRLPHITTESSVASLFIR